jgi:hypothetical protein
MSNAMIPPFPIGTDPVDASNADDESELPVNEDSLDEGETNDDQDKVQEDIIEADAVNSNLDE